MSDLKQKVEATLLEYVKEMEGYAYFSSSPGIPKDEIGEIAERIVNLNPSPWQPIETAPKDGPILAWDGSCSITIEYDAQRAAWIDKREFMTASVSHWMPLPEPPGGEV